MNKQLEKAYTEIPIIFSTDDNYIAFLDVAIRSLIENASRDYTYRLIVLNTGVDDTNVARIKQNETDGFVIDFIDITDRLAFIKEKLKNVYHFSLVTYYRLFIASLFPQYDKVIYLDCDLVVTGDVSAFYHTDLGDSILGVCPEAFVQNTPEFREYASVALGVDPDQYFNAGVLLMNLNAYRKEQIEENFIRMISEYDFDLLDPDQAYLNYLCYNKFRMLENGWNKEPTPLPCEGKKSIVHYALYKKPWQYDDVIDGEYFWHYAALSPFYGDILAKKAAFGAAEKAANEAMALEILEHAKRITASDVTFAKKIGKVR